MEIKVFSSKTCASCKLLIKQLDKLNIKYTYIDIDDNVEEAIANKIMKLPTIIINDKDKVEGYSQQTISRLATG